MHKAWSYIASIAVGIGIGLVLMFKLMGEQVKVVVRKVKNKKTTGNNSVVIPIEINSDTPSRKDKRQARKLNRKDRKK